VFADLVLNAQLFFLIAARILAMVETAPLLSSDAVPQAAKITLAGFAAFAVFPMVRASGYQIPELGLQYALLVGGEAAIGLIIGFFLTIIYTAFTMAGQLYSLPSKSP
jgi:flagellar biosynthetic protein FliR